MGVDEARGGSALAVDNSASGQIVRGERHADGIAGDDPDIMLAHLAGKVGKDKVSAVLELDPEHGIG